MFPVDPVALNIPHYRQIVKQPMDLTTMSQKLKSGQYGTASEFKKDFDLMIKNCLIFNPTGNPVRDLGIQFQREFEQLWPNKEKWERKNQPTSNRASSASGDDESAADDEDDDDEPEEDEKTAKIRALQKQLADMRRSWQLIDFESVRNQSALVCNCRHEDLVQLLEVDFVALLNNISNLVQIILLQRKGCEVNETLDRFRSGYIRLQMGMPLGHIGKRMKISCVLWLGLKFNLWYGIILKKGGKKTCRGDL